MFKKAVAEDRRNLDVGGPKWQVPSSILGSARPVVRRRMKRRETISGVIAREMEHGRTAIVKAVGRSLKHNAKVTRDAD